MNNLQGAELVVDVHVCLALLRLRHKVIELANLSQLGQHNKAISQTQTKPNENRIYLLGIFIVREKDSFFQTAIV